MGRKKLFQRPPPPAPPDPALLEAARAALAALAAAGEEATPSAIEGWIKANQHDVWASIRTASALKAAIEAAQPEGGNGRTAATTKGASRMGRKKKAERPEPAVERPAKREPPGEGNGSAAAAPAPATKPAGRNTAPRARRPRAKREGSEAPAAPRPPRPASPGGYDPTRSELLRVLEIAREQGGVGKLGRLVQAVK